jgi:hypothetical protein
MKKKHSFINLFQSPIEPGESNLRGIIGRCEKETFISEMEFEKMVLLERKKTDRTGRPFLLMLLSMVPERNADIRNMKKFMGDISLALDYSTREIDIKGWYLNNAIIGILCTDINKRNMKILTNRLYSTLKNSINMFHDLHCKVSSMLYPDFGETEDALSRNVRFRPLVSQFGNRFAENANSSIAAR